MATNKQHVEQVKDLSEVAANIMQEAEGESAETSDIEQKSVVMDLFRELDKLKAGAESLKENNTGSASAEELKRLVNTAFDDMEAGVIDNDLIGSTGEEIPEVVNSALDGINEYLNGINTRLEAALNTEDPEEIDRNYKDIQDYSNNVGPQMAEQSLKGLKAIIGSLPTETKETLQDFGIMALIRQFMLTPLEPEAKSTEEQAADLFAALDIVKQTREDPEAPTTGYFYSPINAVIRNMGNILDKGEADLVISNRGKQSETAITAEAWTIGSLEGMEIEGKWEEFDRSIMDSVITLYKSGYRYISVDMVYRAMAAKRSTKNHPNKKMAEAIRKSVEHQRIIKVKCDLTREKEMRERGRKKSKHQIELTQIGDTLLSLFDVDFKIHGQTVHGWYIKHIPIMAWYSDQNGQTVSIKQEYRELITTDASGNEKSAAVTKQRIAMNDYMWRYIEEVRNEHARKQSALAEYNKRREKDPTLKEKTIDDFCKLKRKMLYDTIIDAGGGKRSRQSDINNISFIKGRLLTLKNHKRISDFRELPGKRIDTARGIEFDL